jgi:uncharacterized protein
MILDGHTHIFPKEVNERREDFFGDEPAFRLLYDSPKSKMVGPEEMLAAMDEEGVEAAVILGFPWRQERLWRRHNDLILEAQRRWPRKFFGFCAVHVLSPGALREVERCLAAGFRGVGELAWYDTDLGDDLVSVLAPFAELCGHYRVPLLLHTNDPAAIGAAYPGKAPFSPAAAYRAIKAFPETTWVLAHWGGGLPFYGLLKKEVPETFRNVYFDTAASPYIYRPVIYQVVAEMVGPEKIIFGSDCPLLPPSRYIKEMQAAGLPEDWQEMILGKNLARLMGV